ncbi:heavy-metal-associated domain-containing protein [Clostridium beijerinckii]|uniref:heavy-metal-associated domain-containing protein n=1 Tax=Clostridium beijerinckii TaxID=1520 RepID=UPI000479C753|nr:ferredoxin [Clostridium beijerinckii]
MKSVIKICNMESNQDAKIIQDTVVKNSGVIATEISLTKKEITVIYNEIFLKLERIINSIEDLGYIVI